jgi:galactoside O-acetyltransferase
MSAIARIATGRRYRTMRVGAGSRVDFWRLVAKADNVVEVGAHSQFSSRVVYERPGARLTVGTRSFVGSGLMSIAEGVHIGDEVMISWGATIVDHNSHSLRATDRAVEVERWLQGQKIWTGVKVAPVRVENRAWLGFNVSVLAGVTIGEGAVIGACSVVSKSIPAWTVAAGNPARVLRELTDDERA